MRGKVSTGATRAGKPSAIVTVPDMRAFGESFYLWCQGLDLHGNQCAVWEGKNCYPSCCKPCFAMR